MIRRGMLCDEPPLPCWFPGLAIAKGPVPGSKANDLDQINEV